MKTGNESVGAAIDVGKDLLRAMGRFDCETEFFRWCKEVGIRESDVSNYLALAIATYDEQTTSALKNEFGVTNLHSIKADIETVAKAVEENNRTWSIERERSGGFLE